MGLNRPNFLTIVAVLALATTILDCSNNMQNTSIISSGSSSGGSSPAPSPGGGGGGSTPAPTPTPAGQITVTWAQARLNTDGSALNLTGYKLYYGTASHTYTTTVPATTIGTNNSYILTLTPGTTYYFAVSTVDVNGVEGAQSSELSYTIP